jgi:hypothetical protein
VANRAEILGRSRAKLVAREVPPPTEAELKGGLPLFLDQLIAILRAEKGERSQALGGVSDSATLHGGELLPIGLTVGQLVHDYGSICQSVTELADAYDVAITADEFQTFNRCLNDAIAQAVCALPVGASASIRRVWERSRAHRHAFEEKTEELEASLQLALDRLPSNRARTFRSSAR